ncbi:branched-chain amino acid ABC transporter permease [Actinoplanes lobatus]|uniref:Branched-chain amino acid ABC transporter permease n=1 Tax=Actinoplanes lobatus TaxID=113568 RepID=A0A7W7MI60_9ACTN|nr:branched-chain amino acid ABC transporter permease [Actinoplanes lobatus]MBB4751159.1 branched-chain amino acid transport system permease protein [Actinoplanes lobatus]GGN94639.1 branched-chain amino acid ABC transporter permease [Actinoplanes lobatus]GIE44654.1 branched-chain amino acid ABC transporter permease [Actinoplanes lobatus]
MPTISRWTRTASATATIGTVVAVALAAVPYFAARAETALIDLFLFVALAGLWNLLAGFAGLTSFGQQAYLGVGAYALHLYASAGVDPAWGVLLAAVTAALVSLPVSLLVLRLTAGYFAVATWVVAEVLRMLATVSPRVGGNTGVSLPGAGRHPLVLWHAITYWWALGLMIASVIGIGLLMRSRFGLDARAVHAEPLAAAAAGVAVGRVRRVAYLLAALGTGAVGAVLFCHHLYVQPSSIFGPQYSVYMLFMVLIGGIGTIEGPILGALLFFALQQTLAGYGAAYLVVLGAVAMLVTLFAPRGIWGAVSSRWDVSLLPLGYRITAS